MPTYLLVLWRCKLLVVASAVLAVIVATAVHFTVTDEGLTLRGDREHSAAVTVLLGGGPRNPYAAQIPGVERVPGVEDDQFSDLSNTAVIYAYLASGEEVPPPSLHRPVRSRRATASAPSAAPPSRAATSRTAAASPCPSSR